MSMERFRSSRLLGEVFLEMSKGFEYEGVRRKLRIEPGQRQLDLEISRFVDLRSQGWVSADTRFIFCLLQQLSWRARPRALT